MQQSHPVDQLQATRRPVRAWLSYFLLAFAILFAVLDLDEVEVDWIIGTWQTPLLVVILVFFALGCAAGWIAAPRQRAR